jgi:hypothetical protein
MKEPRREHTDFKTEKSIWDTYSLLRPFKGLRKSMGR